MSHTPSPNNRLQKRYNLFIIILSILIPVVVAILFKVKLSDFGIKVEPLRTLPPIYASINAITAVTLVFAVKAIKKGNKALHQKLINFALLCSILFLLLYVAYHMTSESTPYGGDSFLRYVYYFILLSHILLSVVVIPFVLITYFRGSLGHYEKHKKIARITFPLWLYVAISGVCVYLMISPYYT